MSREVGNITSGIVFNIQRYSLHDGPGIRTVVFLKGCPLRCPWCSNPESLNKDIELAFDSKKCIASKGCTVCRQALGKPVIDFNNELSPANRDFCNEYAELCTNVCPSKAFFQYGENAGVDKIIDTVEKDALFFDRSGGGLTLSGGEPLFQGRFAIELLKEAKRRRIHTAIETCGCVSSRVLLEAAEYLDYIIYDIKILDERRHKAVIGRGSKRTLTNFKLLCEQYPQIPKLVRTPVIPGFNDNEEDIMAINEFLKQFANVSYKLLPYHRFGEAKYAYLGREYPMGKGLELDDDTFEYLKSRIGQI